MDKARQLRGDGWPDDRLPEAVPAGLRVAPLARGLSGWLRRVLGHGLWAEFCGKLVVVLPAVLLALGSAAYFYERQVLAPRVLMVGDLFATQLEAMLSALDAVPAPERESYLRELGRESAGRLAVATPDPEQLEEPTLELAREFLGEIRTRLPGRRMAFSGGRAPLLWVSLELGPGAPGWLRVELPMIFKMPLAYLVAAGVLGVALAALAAGWLTMRLHRRLGWLTGAMDSLDARNGFISVLPSQRSAEDLLELDRHFGELSARLAEAHAERAVMMTSLSRELQDLLRPLLRAQARGEAGGDAARHLAQMERVASQFRDFAQTSGGEPAHPVDVNELLAELVLQRRDGQHAIKLELGGLPYAHLSPVAARRIFGNLLDNALRYGAAPVELRSALEDGRLVVRVSDHGPGVSAEEFALIGRPFYRTEAARARGPGSGLGLAIAQQEVQAHGGGLRWHRPPGGGLCVEVWLPPARLQ